MTRARRMARACRPRRGVALLEAIVALAIFAAVGISSLAMAAESIRAVADARDMDRELREASAFLHAVALWPDVDLDRRLGTRRQGPWLLQIDRRLPGLYLVTLRDSVHASPLLQTALFRPEPAREIE